MSKYDSGKHAQSVKTDTGEQTVVSKKRLDPQRPPKRLAARLADYGQMRGVNDRAYHRPGSQQK